MCPIDLMNVPWDAEGIFKSRPNRFLGIVDILPPNDSGVITKGERVHIHDPGRLKELLYSGNRVLLKRIPPSPHTHRKTSWDLVAALGRDGDWVLVHSGYHRALAEKILSSPNISPLGICSEIRAEVKVGNSRLDFIVRYPNGKENVVEVKGCTLSLGGKALFPDAPTLRGLRHVLELTRIAQNGGIASMIILIFARARCFAPNSETDPTFSRAFFEAIKAGVEVYPIQLEYRDSIVRYVGPLHLCP